SRNVIINLYILQGYHRTSKGKHTAGETSCTTRSTRFVVYYICIDDIYNRVTNRHTTAISACEINSINGDPTSSIKSSTMADGHTIDNDFWTLDFRSRNGYHMICLTSVG